VGSSSDLCPGEPEQVTSEVKRDRYQWCGAVTGAADQAVTGAADFTVTGAADPQWPARCWHRECPVTGEKHMLLTQGTCCARRSPGAHAGLRRLLSGFTPRPGLHRACRASSCSLCGLRPREGWRVENTRGKYPLWLAVAKARIDRWDGSGCTFGKDRDVLEANIIISGDHRDRMLRT